MKATKIKVHTKDHHSHGFLKSYLMTEIKIVTLIWCGTEYMYKKSSIQC
jgi:hypothetical protein